MDPDFKLSIVCILRREPGQSGGEDVLSPAGTGFVVGEDGLIATCAHVVDDAGSGPGGTVALTFRAGGGPRAARVEKWTKPDAQDVAILRLDGPLPSGVVPLALQRSRADEATYNTFGFPNKEGLAGKLEVVGTTTQQGQPVLQVRSDEVTPGFSGAPVVDTATGRVIGMVTSIMRPDKYGRLVRTAFLTPAETLQSVYPDLRASEVCPYRGLNAFTEREADRKYFFGREGVVDQLLHILTGLPRFLVVLGPSGSGKSSLLRAGLIARLQEPGVSGRQQVVILNQYDEPLRRAEEAGLAGASHGLTQAVREWVHGHSEQRLLLIMDQFEELLVTTREPLRRDFLAQLREITDAPLAVTVMVVMRDDFYSLLAQQAGDILARLEQAGIINVPQTLDKSDLIAIIREPARVARLHFEAGLVEDMVDDAIEAAPALAGEGGVARSTVLPLLEFALTQLWEQRRDGMLTHKAYGGITGGLAEWAERAYNSLQDDRLQALARRILTDLVYPGDKEQGIPATRWRRPLTDLYRNPDERDDVYRVVQHLASARLLVTSRDIRTNQETVELIHDALIRAWSELQTWLNKDRQFRAWHDDATRRAEAWEANGRDQERLLRGRDLIDAHRELIDHGSDLRQIVQRFIEASIEEDQRKRAATTRFMSIVTNLPRAGPGSLSLGFVVPIALLLLLQVLGPLSSFELGAYNALLQGRGSGAIPRNLAVLEVYNTSPPSGWDMAHVIKDLSRDGARAIGVYIPYYDKKVKADTSLALLARTIRNARDVILVDSIQDISTHIGSQSINLQEPQAPLPDNQEGVDNLPKDADFQERALDLTPYGPGDTLQDVPYPSFALETVKVFEGHRRSVAQISSGLPAHMLINYQSRQSAISHYPFYPVADVGRDGARLFRNKIVLIIPATAQSVVNTPEGPMYEGYVQANALETILQRDPISDTGRITLLLTVFFVLVVAPLAGRLVLAWSTAVTAALAGGYAFSAFFLMISSRVWVHLVAPEAAILLTFVVVTALRLYAAQSERRRAVAMLGPQLELPIAAAPLATGGRAAAPALIQQPVTVLCARLCDVSALAERLDAEQLRSVLEEYQRELAESSRRRFGDIGYRAGETFVAVWVESPARGDHRLLAVEGALDMVNRMEAINRRLGGDSLPDIAYGIGIGSGAAVVGRMRTPVGEQPVAVGDAVEMAEQLSRVARPGDILADESTYRSLADRLDVKETTVPASGFGEPISRAFQVVGVAPVVPLAPTTLAGDAV